MDPSLNTIRTADLLGALSLAADLAVGLPAEHAARSCYIGLQIGTELGLSAEEQADLYYAELLMDAGCTAFTSQLAAYIMGEEIAARRDLYFHTDVSNPLAVTNWLARYMAVGQPLHVRASRSVDFAVHGKEQMREGFRNTCDAAQRFASRLGMSLPVQNALLSIFEQWDGAGMPRGLKGEAIPLIARIVYATSFLEVFHHLGGACSHAPACARAAREGVRPGRRGCLPLRVRAFRLLGGDRAGISVAHGSGP